MSTAYPSTRVPDVPGHVLVGFEAVVFDLDGVITDTAAIHALAWKRAMDDLLDSMGEHATPFDLVGDYREHIDGRPRLDGAAAFLESRGIRLERGTPEDLPTARTLWALATRKNALFLTELERRGVSVFPDAQKLLGRLAQLPMRSAVVTASQNGATVLRKAGLAGRFDVTVTGVEAQQWHLPGKPAPDTFLRAAEQLGVNPRRAVVCEDAATGVQAARAGGFGLVVGVDRDHRRDELARRGADVILTDLAELLTLTHDTLATAPGRSLDRLFDAILICPQDDSAASRQHLDGVVDQVRTSGTLVAIAGTDPSATLASLVDRAARAGIAPGSVLAIGWPESLTLPDRARDVTVLSVAEEPVARSGHPTTRWLAGGWPALRAVLGDQAQRRRTSRVPSPPSDPGWSLVIRGDHRLHERAQQSLLTVADTRFGTRGTREEDPPAAVPGVLAAGVYDESVEPATLVEGPGWTGLQVATAVDSREDERVFDLRTGVLYRSQPAVPVPLRSARFASLAHPGVQAMRAEGGLQWLHAGPALTPPIGDGLFSRRQAAGRTWVTSTAHAGGGVCAGADQRVLLGEGGAEPVRVVDRLVAMAAHPSRVPDEKQAEALLETATELGFDRLLAEQRRAWTRRWDDALISIDGDPDNELAVRFALFHLMACAPVTGEAAIGPRGLSGPTYRGHVFWDADVFVLPFLAATCPAAAQAMLRYRTRRLPQARRLAAADGRAGARFPWESARTGIDVTPSYGRSLDGELIPIRTGRYEEHITADVAWAATQLAAWTGQPDLLHGAARTLVLDTARYWASRIRVDDQGRGHIDGVIGPDEYHEVVDDNVFTNVMARWNLRTAAALAGPAGVDPAEAQGWLRIADGLVDNFDPGTRVYEQFAGYFGLEPTTIEQIATPPVAADLLLGPERISGSQIIKQADVLMLHHLVPDEVAAESLRANLDFYLPRCAHGSSLSPAIHASLLARDGRPDEALRLFDMACRLDLDDLTETTAGGLHTATFGGVWQALVHGFAGIRPHESRLRMDPCLPSRWTELRLRLRFRGVRVEVIARHDELRVVPNGTVDVEVPGTDVTRVSASGHTWRRIDERWRIA